nr:hypothetical protein [Alcaligenes faecalis]
MTDQNPGFPRTRRRNQFDGRGCYAPNSSKIPLKAWIGAALVVFIFIGLFAKLGAAAGLN